MSKDELELLRAKIVEGIKLSTKRLIEKKRAENGKLAYSINGKVVIVNAIDVEID